MYRQGDVLMIPVEEVPAPDSEAGPCAGDRWVLVEGEATGHAHTIRRQDAVSWINGGRTFLQVVAETKLEHQEHLPIPVAVGIYEVVRQREYDPMRDMPVTD